jgi:hypothetical protein
MNTEHGYGADRSRRVTVSETEARLSRKRVRGLMAVVLAMVLMGLAAPVHGDEFSRLQGAWDCDEDGARSSLEFLSTTQLSYNGQVAAIELAPDSFLVEEEYGTVLYVYGFEGDSLVILAPDGSLTWCGKSALPVSAPMASGQSSDVGDASPGALVPGPGWPVYERPVGTVSEDAPTPQALLYKFAGRWDHVSTNTLTNLYLGPDGTYESSYEASYSGEDGDWGAAGHEQDRGQWMIEGSLREGVLTLIAPNGDRAAYRYQVHVRDGETYWSEYFFDGELYSVDYVYR